MNTKEFLWAKFDEHFKAITEELSHTNGHSESGIGWSIQRIKNLLEYNAPLGKRTRGLTVVSAFHSICGDKVTESSLDVALTLGWAVEILQASFLVADDLMDQSKTRRGQMCWYRKPGIGYQAVNDSMILESCVFTLLRKHCRDKEWYADVVDLFHKTILNTEMGQSLDMATSEQPDVDIALFTQDRYNAIIKYKTAFYSFYLPVALAMYICGIQSEDLHAKACSILTEMGCLFQVQDDYLDCYGDPKITGKIGTDIEDRKCSWLVVQAIKKVNPQQMKMLKNHYGIKNEESVNKIKELYKELELELAFKEYEVTTYNELTKSISKFEDPEVPHSVFLDLLNKIYKRNK